MIYVGDRGVGGSEGISFVMCCICTQGFVPDRDVNGQLDPVLTAVNRQVIIELIPDAR